MRDSVVFARPAASEKPFYGWTILAAAFVIITMSIGMLFTLAIFLKPMEEAMGWSRSNISSVGLVNWVVMGLGGVLAGFVSDRIGTRAVVLVGSGLLGLGLVLSSQVTALWQLYVTFGILVAGGVSAFYVPLTVPAIKCSATGAGWRRRWSRRATAPASSSSRPSPAGW